MIALKSRGLQLSILLAATVFASKIVYCQSTFLPYVSTQYEHNNNVFDLPNSSAAYAADGDPRLGDSDLRSVAGFDENYFLGRQRFYATVEGRYIDYDYFTYLNHYEYLVKLGLDWKLTSTFDGTFLGSLQRLMAPFANRNTTTALAIDLDHNVIGKFNVRITPEWRLETSVQYHDLESPIQGYPDYGLSETTGHAAVKYLGFANLTYGVSVDYLDGNYRNSPTPGSYIQTNYDVTMTYAVSGLSSFNGAIGHTQRDQGQDQGTASGVTGELGYTKKITGKTSINVDYLRQVNSYIAAGGSELDSTVAVRLNYQPTFKTSIVVSYQYLWSDFLGQTIPGSDALGRKDRTPAATFKINYQALRWLMIQPYANYQRRNSNEEQFEFSSTIVGIQVLAKMPAPPQAPLR